MVFFEVQGNGRLEQIAKKVCEKGKVGGHFLKRDTHSIFV